MANLDGGQIGEADHVLLVCTELYLKKVRQQVSEDEGQGVCWEANIIYALLYERKLNTTKFSPVVFSPVDRRFIPTLLKGRDCFIRLQKSPHLNDEGPYIKQIYRMLLWMGRS